MQTSVDSATSLMDTLLHIHKKGTVSNGAIEDMRTRILYQLNIIVSYTDSFNLELEQGKVSQTDHKLFFEKINLKAMQEKNDLLRKVGVDFSESETKL